MRLSIGRIMEGRIIEMQMYARKIILPSIILPSFDCCFLTIVASAAKLSARPINTLSQTALPR